MNKLKAIETFINVVNYKGFATAGKHLNLSPASVSRLIKELEEELGVLLIKRSNRSFTLTQTGERFFSDCKEIIRKLNDAETEARSGYSTPSGQLIVSAPSMFGSLFLTSILTEFISTYPKITVRTKFTDEIVNLIEDNVDVTIRIGELQDSSLMAKKVGSVSWVTCASPEYLSKYGEPKSPDELIDHNLIEIEVNEINYEWKFKDKKVIKPTGTLKVNSVMAAKYAAFSGWGIARVYSYQIIPEIENGTLVPILSEYDSDRVPIHIIHSEGRRVSAKIRALSQLVDKRLRFNKHLNP